MWLLAFAVTHGVWCAVCGACGVALTQAELCTKCWHNGVQNWHKDLSCVGQASTVYLDLRDCDNNKLLPDGQCRSCPVSRLIVTFDCHV
jgi:hypothetical protein